MTPLRWLLESHQLGKVFGWAAWVWPVMKQLEEMSPTPQYTLLKKCRPIDLGWSLGDLEPLRRIQSGCQLAMCVFESTLALDSQKS